MFNVIVARDLSGNIGYKNKLPWKCSEDMEYFKNTAVRSGNVLICGRKTFESLPILYSKICTIIILSRRGFCTVGAAIVVNNFNAAIRVAANINSDPQKVWVIGGGEIYNIAINSAACNKLYINVIQNHYRGDVKLPIIRGYRIIKRGILPAGTITQIWARKPHDGGYMKLLIAALNSKQQNSQIPRYNTIRLFGRTLNYRIEEILPGFYRVPFITTKRLFVRGAFEELKFFISGKTNTKELEKKGINIWKSNTSAEYLKSRGLNYECGEMGPLYGYQWRNFNKPFTDNNNNNNNADQLLFVINTLKENPNSRGAVMSSWNPLQLNQACLYPCHVLYQFLISDGKLICCMYQRSGDLFLGVPFNMIHTIFLTIWLAQILKIKPGAVHHFIADAHLYVNHITAAKTQINIAETEPPLLKMPIIKSINDIANLSFKKINIKWTHKAPVIKAKIII